WTPQTPPSRTFARSCWTPRTPEPSPSSTADCSACATDRGTSRRRPASPTNAAGTGWCCGTGAAWDWPSSRWRTCLGPPGPMVRTRRCCTWTPRWRMPGNWPASATGPSSSAPPCCSTGLTTPTSRSTCSPTPPGTRSASSWP
ncbi:MAG: hypothetical protein AVDCRST_MAG61-2100, partial [uncultured Friedmanniella sp.]